MSVILKFVVGVVLLIMTVEIIFSPRIDITRNGDVLLFYGRRKRKYKKLFKL